MVMKTLNHTRPLLCASAFLLVSLVAVLLLAQADLPSSGRAVAAAVENQDPPPPTVPISPPPVVQLVLLLDTSNSMDGLIEQAKSQLWKIVNEFITAKQNGQRPDLQVALFEYGKSSLSAKGGYIRMVQPLTNDLDKISEELFALRTNGGEEYCGWVIQEAVQRLGWDPSGKAYKAIF